MRIVVVGLGKVGRALTAQLTAENNDIVVIDQNPDLIEDIVNIYDVRGLAGNGGCYDVQKEAFEDGAVVSVETLIEAGVVKNPRDGVKILGNGELTKKLTVQANAFSASAKEKIEALGGKAEVI